MSIIMSVSCQSKNVLMYEVIGYIIIDYLKQILKLWIIRNRKYEILCYELIMLCNELLIILEGKSHICITNETAGLNYVPTWLS